jgi:hypothetical protein
MAAGAAKTSLGWLHGDDVWLAALRSRSTVCSFNIGVALWFGIERTSVRS